MLIQIKPRKSTVPAAARYTSGEASPYVWRVFLVLTALGISGPSPIYGAANPTTEPLLQQAGLVYQGSFRVPNCYPYDTCGGAAFGYAANGAAYNPQNDSLFLAGSLDTGEHRFVAEIRIPPGVSAANTTLSSLPIANDFVQSFHDVFEGHLQDVEPYDPTASVSFGGMLPYNGKLYISAFVYYDGNGQQSLSHFIHPLNLSVNGQLQGPFAANARAGFIDGYFGLVPPQWQSLLGGPVLNGNCCLSIISRSSYGPSVFAIDPAQIGVINPFPAQPLVNYPNDGQLGVYNNQNPVFNGSTQVFGVVFPQGSASVLFFGKHGSGPVCYGKGTGDPALVGTIDPGDGEIFCNDPAEPGKGYHAYPYREQVWAYDAKELAAVRAGTKNPWDVKPYAYWGLSSPIAPWATHAIGAAYDPANQRIFVITANADGVYPANPLIDVYHVNLTGSPNTLCDVNQDGTVTVVDVQQEINQVLSGTSCTVDIDMDGHCTVIDVQRVVNVVLGGVCVSP